MERLINCIVLFYTLTAHTAKPAFLFSFKKRPYFPLASRSRQGREHVLRKGNVYIFSIIFLVTMRQGYPNCAHKAYFAITLFSFTINIIITKFCSYERRSEGGGGRYSAL